MMSGVDRALKTSYPDRRFDVPPFFQFGSWIGGDRDGNPFVTTPVTRTTLKQNALASLRHYRAKVTDLARALSITERAASVPESFRAELARELEASGDAAGIRARNPGEAYRQYLTCVLRKLDATIARTEGAAEAPEGRPYYANADELIVDLRVLENALEEANLASIAADLVRPVRFAVQIFRFSTVRLDLRENTTRTTEALQEIWRMTAGRERRRHAGARLGGVEGLDHGRACAAARSRPRARRVVARGRGDAVDVPPRAGDAGATRPRGLRQLHPVDDALGRRRARRLCARQGGRRLPRCRRHRDLPAADRALVRDHRRSSRGARHHARAARGAARPPLDAAGRAACRR